MFLFVVYHNVINTYRARLFRGVFVILSCRAGSERHAFLHHSVASHFLVCCGLLTDARPAGNLSLSLSKFISGHMCVFFFFFFFKFMFRKCCYHLKCRVISIYRH
jgi:hypothetical protein